MKTTRHIVTASLILLCGCAAQKVAYEPRPINTEEARAIVEQVIMEQPPAHRPAAIEFAPGFIAIQFGQVTQGRATATPVGNAVIADGSAMTKEMSTRLYFNTIARTNLHHKRDWYVLDVVDSNERVLQRAYCRDEAKAHRFIDAIAALKN